MITVPLHWFAVSFSADLAALLPGACGISCFASRGIVTSMPRAFRLAFASLVLGTTLAWAGLFRTTPLSEAESAALAPALNMDHSRLDEPFMPDHPVVRCGFPVPTAVGHDACRWSSSHDQWLIDWGGARGPHDVFAFSQGLGATYLSVIIISFMLALLQALLRVPGGRPYEIMLGLCLCAAAVMSRVWTWRHGCWSYG
ncbi:MAG: hypothetical protein HZB39_14275 [Planctomycetes bacterium]|nr:hypothetical protein [Planctomycetota bacterium]